ncbi:MAG: glucokinase [Desulfovibrionaceae bacterium]|nr:glucokinase [Desulfovibrionaceae bacterium]
MAEVSRLLAFDIGGTNCRMALFTFEEGGRLAMHEVHSVPTRKVHTAEELHYAARFRLGQEAVDSCTAVAAAVAGPVVEGRACLSNADLTLDQADVARCFGAPAELLNDFMAVCHAVDSPAGAEAEHLWGEAEGAGVRAVLGAGTGFGCAALVRSGGTELFMPSEGGHMAFAFMDEEERAFEPFLLKRQKVNWASTDDVVTGRGLKSLAAHVTGMEYNGRECGAMFLRDGVDGPDNKVGRMFARFYARAARNWVLATLCSGGLWIGGGIGIKNRALLRSRTFREEFVQGVHAAFLERVPVYLFNDDSYGLWGAGMAALKLVRGMGAQRA